MDNVAEDIGTRCLVGTTLGSGAHCNDEKVQEDTERSETKDDGRDGCVDLPKVTRERTT